MKTPKKIEPIHKFNSGRGVTKYNLNDVFGIWKNKSNSLNKVREEQWRKKIKQD